MKFARNPIRHHPPHLRHFATLPWETENSNFWPPVNCACVPQFSQQLINAMLCPAFLGKFVCQPLCWVYKLLMTVLSSSLNILLIVEWTNTAVTWRLLWRISDVTNWSRK